MTPDRFQALAEAYGGDLARWPQDEQADAQAWRMAHPTEAAAILDEAEGLDQLLAIGSVEPPGPLLRDRIVASALTARRPVRRTLLWASATALMAACAAGVMLGVDFSGRLLPDPAAESVTQTATAFDVSGSYFDTTATTGTAG